MSDKTLRIVDEHGEEKDYEILFTFHSEETAKSYVIYKEFGDTEEVFASVYTETEGQDGGDLLPVETDEEWEMIEAQLDVYLSQADEE